jgi:hypothetical protein
MDSLQTGDVAEAGKVEPNDLADERRIADELLDRVPGRPRMGRCSLIPVGPVQAQAVIHGGTVTLATRLQEAT